MLAQKFYTFFYVQSLTLFCKTLFVLEYTRENKEMDISREKS